VEGIGQDATVVRIQCGSGGRDQRNALVGRTEEHVEGEAGLNNRRGITATQHRQRGAIVKGASIEEVRTYASGLQCELAKAQRVARQRETDEIVPVVLHVVNPKAAMIRAVRIITPNAGGIYPTLVSL